MIQALNGNKCNAYFVSGYIKSFLKKKKKKEKKKKKKKKSHNQHSLNTLFQNR